MVNITFIAHDGLETSLEVKPGTSVMDAAVSNGVDGILGDCGGSCACATCHCYIDEAWRERVGGADENEQSLLEFAEDVRPESRLGCQIKLTEELDGLIVRLPETQG